MASGFFHELVPPPPPLSIPIGPFQIFSQIRGDINSSRCTTGVNDSGGKWQKSSNRKILIILSGHLWVVELTYILNFCLQVRFKMSAARYCTHYLPPVSLVNLPVVSTTLAKLMEKFAAGVVDEELLSVP